MISSLSVPLQQSLLDLVLQVLFECQFFIKNFGDGMVWRQTVPPGLSRLVPS